MTIATPTAAAELLCFNPACRARFAITEVLYNCPHCGGLIEAGYAAPDSDAADTQAHLPRPPLEQRPARSKRRLALSRIVSVPRRLQPTSSLCARATRLCSTRPARPNTAGSTRITFKHQGFNPTGSFKDNGMTCGVAQARRLGMKRVACVSTGNTSASMAAYAAAGGLEAAHLPAARQHLFRQARAGARIRRENVAGGGQFRSDPRAGPRARRTPRHLSAQLRSIPSASKARRASCSR